MQAESEGRMCADRNVWGEQSAGADAAGDGAGSRVGSDRKKSLACRDQKGATSLLAELSAPALRVPSSGRRRGEVGRGSGAWILALALPLHHAISLGLRSLPYKMGMNKKKNSSYHSLSHRSMPGTFLNLTDNCCTKYSQQQLVVVLFPFQMRKQAQQG